MAKNTLTLWEANRAKLCECDLTNNKCFNTVPQYTDDLDYLLKLFGSDN